MKGTPLRRRHPPRDPAGNRASLCDRPACLGRLGPSCLGLPRAAGTPRWVCVQGRDGRQSVHNTVLILSPLPLPSFCPSVFLSVFLLLRGGNPGLCAEPQPRPLFFPPKQGHAGSLIPGSSGHPPASASRGDVPARPRAPCPSPRRAEGKRRPRWGSREGHCVSCTTRTSWGSGRSASFMVTWQGTQGRLGVRVLAAGSCDKAGPCPTTAQRQKQRGLPHARRQGAQDGSLCAREYYAATKRVTSSVTTTRMDLGRDPGVHTQRFHQDSAWTRAPVL